MNAKKIIATIIFSLLIHSTFKMAFADEIPNDDLAELGKVARTQLGPEVKLERYTGWSSTLNSNGQKVRCNILIGREDKTQKIRYLTLKSNSELKTGITLGFLANVGGFLSDDIKKEKKDLENKVHDEMLLSRADVLPKSESLEKQAIEDAKNAKLEKIIDDNGALANIINRKGTPKLSLSYDHSDSFFKKTTEVNYAMSVAGFSVAGVKAVAKLNKTGDMTEIDYTLTAGLDSNMKCVDLINIQTIVSVPEIVVPKEIVAPKEIVTQAIEAPRTLPELEKKAGEEKFQPASDVAVSNTTITKTPSESNTVANVSSSGESK